MPSSAPKIPQIQYMQLIGGPPVAAEPINTIRAANEGEYARLAVDIDGAAPAGVYQGNGIAVTLSTPDRSVYPPTPGPGVPFNDRNRSFVVTMHSTMDQIGVRPLLGRLPAITDLPVANAAAMSGILPAFAWAAAQPDGYINASRASFLEPFALFDDATAENTGPLVIQLSRQDVVNAYTPSLDQGNTGYLVLKTFVPIVDGLISGRAAERADETTGSGPVWVLVRPKRNLESAPLIANPENPDGADDLITPSFFQLGCLMNPIDMNKVVEFSETRKNFNDTVTDRTLSQNLLEIAVSATSNSVYVQRIINAGIVQDANAWFKQVIPGTALETFEVVILTTNSKGYINPWYIPSANIVATGTESKGNRTDGSATPMSIMTNSPARQLFGNSLYQDLDLIVSCTVNP